MVAAMADKPRTGRARRVLKRGAVGLAVVLGAIGAVLAFDVLWNPTVPLAAPRVVTRVRHGSDVTVVLGGDFAPTSRAMGPIRAHGYHFPYETTASILRDADVSFANLESPITQSNAAFWPYKDWIYRVDPEAVAAWQWLGLDAVNLANNHVIDYRERGLRDTLDYLSAGRIEQVGAGRSESAARRPLVFDVSGTRVGILAYLEDRIDFRSYLRTFAVGDGAGCAKLGRVDVEEDVRRLRPLVDVLVVSVHWGANYADVTEQQEEWAHALAGLGVDVVAGHGSHVAQRVERIGRTVVLHSLGNYAWGARGLPEVRLGMLARLHIAPRNGRAAGRITHVDLIPLFTQNRTVNYQPQILPPAELAPLVPDDPFWHATTE